MPNILEKTNILTAKLIAFNEAIESHEQLEIDSDYIKEPASLKTHYLKVVNHEMKGAYGVPLSAIIEYPVERLIKALESGIFRPLYGVTRIVGYYSRISNWNKSKVGELADRHNGDYSVSKIQ